MNFTPFPILQTERLVLRQLKLSDADAVLYLRSDKTINKYIHRPENRQTKTIEDATNHIKKLTNQIETNTSISWGISLKENPEIIGSICLWNFSEDKTIAEVGYDLSTAFHNKEIMSEALKEVIRYGKTQLKLNHIEAYTHKDNNSSKALLEKHNFHLVERKIDQDNLNNSIYRLDC